MIGNEYSYRTLKQNLIDGMTKKEFLKSKLYAILAFVACSTFLVFCISLLLGGLYSDYNELAIVFSEMDYLLAYALKLFGFFTFCLFLALLVKRAAFALGFLALWQVAEGIAYGLMRWKLSDLIPALSAEQVIQFFPLQALGNLIPEPFTRLSAIQNIANQLGEGLNRDYNISIFSLLIVFSWSLIFIWASYKLLKKRDL